MSSFCVSIPPEETVIYLRMINFLYIIFYGLTAFISYMCFFNCDYSNVHFSLLYRSAILTIKYQLRENSSDYSFDYKSLEIDRGNNSVIKSLSFIYLLTILQEFLL